MVDDYTVVEENTYYDLEGINLLKYDREFTMADIKKEPAIYSGSLFGFRTLYYNIFLSGR
jgi:hypothetical protein